ncbi:MAG: hypothetical protein RBU30_08335, partial [Polyangia bacterium]|nr:hypothetical protein [Polyangia bacterium]
IDSSVALDASGDAASLVDGALDAEPDANLLCGNGMLDQGEACDGTDLGGEICKTRGHLGGVLACAGCQFDDSGCWDSCGGTTGHNCPASSVTDDFEDQVRGTIWANYWEDGGATTQETAGGKLRFELPVAETGYAGYMTYDPCDFREDAITLEVNTAPDQTAYGAESAFYVTDVVSGESIGFSLNYGLLCGFHKITSYDLQWSVTYQSNPHKYWRLRESGGFFGWDTSPDGSTWLEQGIIPNPFPMDDVWVVIMAGCFQIEAAPGVAVVDNYNILP